MVNFVLGQEVSKKGMGVFDSKSGVELPPRCCIFSRPRGCLRRPGVQGCYERSWFRWVELGCCFGSTGAPSVIHAFLLVLGMSVVLTWIFDEEWLVCFLWMRYTSMTVCLGEKQFSQRGKTVKCGILEVSALSVNDVEKGLWGTQTCVFLVLLMGVMSTDDQNGVCDGCVTYAVLVVRNLSWYIRGSDSRMGLCVPPYCA